ncbi:MAG TPA: RNase adapter RapZ [Rhodospirillales bacterium]|nr:RNase adapter RapZ [Rhodospirillales bacterium]
MPRTVIVTGMAGAGRSSALKILEDLGFEAVDNLPLPLLPRLLQGEEEAQDLALGIDTRSRRFAPDLLLARIAARAAEGEAPVLLFLDADDETLLRRFTETRRRHPLAQDRPVADGIARERRLLAPLRAAADLVVDTSRLALPELRRLLESRFGVGHGPGLVVTVMSFAYRNGLPREADLVFDVRFLRNPHYEEALRPLTGRDPEVGGFIAADEAFAPFETGLLGLLRQLLPRYRREGKSYLTIALGCTGGRHRSVFVAERVARRLQGDGWRVNLLHRELPAP